MSKYLFLFGALCTALASPAQAQIFQPIEPVCAIPDGNIVPPGYSQTGIVSGVSILPTSDCTPNGMIDDDTLTPATATEGMTVEMSGAINAGPGDFAGLPDPVMYIERIQTVVGGLTPGQSYTVSVDVQSLAADPAIFAVNPALSDDLTPDFFIQFGATSFVIPVGFESGPAATTACFEAVAQEQDLVIGAGVPEFSSVALFYYDNLQIELTETCQDDEVDPLPQLSSKDQSLSAMRAFGSIMRHVEYRLETSGQHHDDYLLQFTFENEDRGLGQGGRWTAFGLSSTELDGQLSGDGTFVYGLAGWDMNEGEDSLWGYVLGAEYGDRTYVGEGDVQKLGISAGLYGGRLLGERLQVTGYLTYTHFFNEFENTLGQTANMQSDRLIGAVQINGKIGTSGGFTVKPYLDAQYAIERHKDYTYSGGGASFQGGTAEIGEIGLGAEINLPFNERWGSAFVRIEANKTFGDDAITLSNGTVLTPNDDVTGSLGLGWVTNTSYDSIGRLELSINDIGNDARQEIRFDGHWERNF